MTAATGKALTVPYRLNPSRYGCHSLLARLLPPEGEGRWVLDVGCNAGYFSRMLAERGYQVIGIDCRAGSGFPRDVRFVEHNLDEGLPRLDGRFDYIICADVLEHLQDPVAALHELSGLLTPGGRILGSLPNSGNIYFRLVVLSGRFPKHDRGLFDRTHRHFMTWRDWRDLFAGAGLRIESVQPSSLPFALVFPQSALKLFVRVAEPAWFLLARVWKKLFAYQFIVSAVRE
jgi:SAM-dependent methyltransferase